MNKEILEIQAKSNINKNLLNPFIPTNRDIDRTEELASKNAVAAGVLSFVFVPVGLLYLNRGINSLKILGYIFALSFMLSLVTEAEGSSNKFSNLLGLIGTGAITAEQVMAINKARQRLQEKSVSVSVFEKNDLTTSETNQEAVNQLKELKKKYENNEISEEEFKLQKQIVLKSI